MKKLKISIRHCSVCSARNQFEGTETICNKCYMASENEEMAAQEVKAAAWAAAHKCRSCSKGLELSRYYNCDKCVNLSSLEEEEFVGQVQSMKDIFGNRVSKTAVPARGV